MKTKPAILVVLVAAVAVSLFLANRSSAPNPSEREAPQASMPAPSPTPAAAPVERVPPYHLSAEAAQPYPRTLSPTLFAIPAVARAYETARRIPGVLAQQPCYCWCDKFGHGSLLDCYATDHGAG